MRYTRLHYICNIKSLRTNMNKLIPNIAPRQMFLVDSLGALVSALLLGIILVRFNDVFGLPVRVLYPLAAIALTFCLYSLGCYLLVRKKAKPYLQLIAVLNLLYCLLTIILVYYHHSMLSVLGYLYFMGEIIIITLLAYIELSVAPKAG